MPSWREPPEPVSGVWIAYRQTSPESLPLWYGAGPITLRQESGRWHREGRGVAQYLSLSAEGAWAERIRYESIRDEDRRREDRRALWQMQVAEERIGDLSTFDRYLACGLRPELAVQGDHRDVWPLAYELRDAGYRGVLSPSAALDVPGAVNLALFGERFDHRVHGPMPDPSTLPGPQWIATVLLVESAPPSSYAMNHARYRGETHRTFAAWTAAAGYNPSR